MKLSGTRRTTAVALATVGLAVLPSAHATAGAGNAGYQAPKIGTCSTMTETQYAARSDRSQQVPCSQAHQARVVGVVQLPDQLQWDTVSDRRVFKVAVTKCLIHVTDAIGRSARQRDVSAYGYGYFIPTKPQRSHGARWISCSLVLRRGPGLADLPTDATPALPKGALPDGLARCLNRAGFTTTCAAGHHYRATGTFVVSTDSYPGRKALDRKANAKCASRVPTKHYAWTHKDRTTWQVAGDHVVVCYSVTTS